ncbi:Zn(II)2Cys6 transcription factor [Aspergillus puulaauensis]|uniref:Zn(2)-C6 fungal-type domain-containing protein n=1 Tax=Aspergillus puulaauensis TaxID=1220207 RepID=A0A7R7XV99_9EURO|nr:uncharacterized protein APUU_61115S [Aspergillus puulaauensis]BCS28067.1 hypothetical protein APUU_61115S [Aspergillus puulaauensis]
MNSQRRARLVCYRCHSKKIKCDLAQQSQSRSCRHCTQAKAACQLRPSKRGLGKRRVPRDVALDPPVEEARENIATQHSAPFWSPVARHAVAASQIPSPDSIQSNHGNQDPDEDCLPVNQASCFGDTGYMQLLSRDVANYAPTPATGSQQSILVPASNSNITISPPLQASFLESYAEYCHTWCPVLDQDLLLTHIDHSPLLQHALALCCNRVNPPLIRARDSADYYAVAKAHFHSGAEKNGLVLLASIMLFWWWSTGSATLVSMDNAWWWTGIAIRIAQEMGLHREPPSTLPQSTAGLRRRIWWTLFIRDRILALSQGRPTNIDQDFCTVEMSLPASITLNIRSPRTLSFNRDIHRLHLSYLTAVILLNLTHSQDSSPLPRASEVAIIAASCIARLWEDYLARGNIRFLSGDAGWEIAVALLALLDARRVEALRVPASADIETLRTALCEMARLWPSSRMFEVAFYRLFDECHGAAEHVGQGQEPADPLLMARDNPAIDPDNYNDNNAAETSASSPTTTDWMEYFPFITGATSALIDAVLARNPSSLAVFTGPLWPLDINEALQAFLAQPGVDWEEGVGVDLISGGL